MIPNESDMLKLLYEMNNTKFNRCLEPQMKCKNKAIRAHSIQNAKVLDMLSVNGQIVAIKRKMLAKEGLRLSFGQVGRNQATTFEGLCKDHDRKLFLDIDNKTIDPGNNGQLLLLAYRAVIREQHAQIQEAFKAQTGYIKRVNLGLDPADRSSDFGLHATALISNSYNTYVYRVLFDKILSEMDFSRMSHDTIELNVVSPTIACSSLFSIDNMQNRKGEVVRACLNIVPLASNRTMALFSYHENDVEQSRSYLGGILTSSGTEQKYEISKLMLNHCENFVISPAYYNSWAPEKEKVLLDYFMRTVYQNDFSYNHTSLQLFN